MSKSTKKVLAVVAAVAVPFVAPAIAGSIGLTSALASTGMAATTAAATGSALTGAVLGGAASSFGGGDFGTGAVLGAVGGGLSGYGAATRAATAVPEGSTLAIGPRGEYLAAPGAGVSGPPAPVNLVAAGPGAVAAPVAGTAGAAGAVTPAATATATGTAAAGTAPTLGAALSSAVAGLTDPATLARVTMLASTALSEPDADIMAGLSPQEVELVEMRKQELQRIASTNMSLFEQQVMAAQNFLQQAEQQGPNPEQAYGRPRSQPSASWPRNPVVWVVSKHLPSSAVVPSVVLPLWQLLLRLKSRAVVPRRHNLCRPVSLLCRLLPLRGMRA